MRLIYAAEAVADLVRLRDFIAEKDPTAAARTAQNPIARTENLCRFSLMGRNIDRAPDSGTLRELIFGNYVAPFDSCRCHRDPADLASFREARLIAARACCQQRAKDALGSQAWPRLNSTTDVRHGNATGQ